MVFAILAYIIPLMLAAVLLYYVIRLGVKHGMRSYFAEVKRPPNSGSD
ncbi:hypothetical protein BJ994_001731 [Arthrobacter pigmenti]|uniref:Uncharacterized protein n=1 Tax=Arthrobacter pigmenti TaxID=271432 RepID=A0A846RSK5_9MICC|nr:hypothetical protein [Arthrobacter pigmenti]NJC22655.1 hypothetical protein [Arthrobacter pigmenti]